MRLVLSCLLLLGSAVQAALPNILWLTFEDSSPHLGCYGDKNAVTPNLDALAHRGMRYKTAWSNAPVCAPARTGIISGRWAPSDGAEQMRSEVPLPKGHQMSAQIMRELGYYCTNADKEDYNLTKPAGVWDESSPRAHWKNRKDGQPFFAIFNSTRSHESQIRKPGHTLSHDPAKVEVPPYQPDTPEVRKDWATHFDNVTTIDREFGKHLAELEKAGLTEDTIVFAYSDHGTGMPRSKRWAQSSGLRVPFIVYFPEKWKHLAPKDYAVGSESQRLIQFIDLAPTLLSLAGRAAPDYMHGRAFAGQYQAEAPNYVYGFRGRMDERYDMVRSITDGRYVYVRHFMPHLPEGQKLEYMFQQATTVVWYDLFQAGKLSAVQSAMWKEKPSEMLFDLQSDPHEVTNLAAAAEHAPTKQRLSSALTDWLVSKRDLGFIPEAQRLADAAGQSPADASVDAELQKQRAAAALKATDRSVADASDLLQSTDAACRYWGCIGQLIRSSAKGLAPLLSDASPSVRVAAAEVLAKQGSADEQAKAWSVLLQSAVPSLGSAIEATEALNVIDRQGAAAKPHADTLAKLNLQAPKSSPGRTREYPNRMISHLAKELGFPEPAPTAKGKGKRNK
jgi:arylsulfatase A-like enzyme